MIDREKLEEEIRGVAYELYVKSGCIPGRDLDNWLEAKRIVLAKYGIKEEEYSQSTKTEIEEKPKKRRGRACKREPVTKKGDKRKGKKL